jgi:hypothetical protein
VGRGAGGGVELVGVATLARDGGVEGVAQSVEGVVVLPDRLLGGGAGAGGAAVGEAGVGVGAELAEGVDAAGGDVEAAGAVIARGEEAGNGLDALAYGVGGFLHRGGELLCGTW